MEVISIQANPGVGRRVEYDPKSELKVHACNSYILYDLRSVYFMPSHNNEHPDAVLFTSFSPWKTLIHAFGLKSPAVFSLRPLPTYCAQD